MTGAVFDVVGLRGAVLGQFLGQPWFARPDERPRREAVTCDCRPDQAWPARADAVTRAPEIEPAPNDALLRRPDVSWSKQIVDDLALVYRSRRRGDRAVSPGTRGENASASRRSDPSIIDRVPVDPHSGWPLLLRAEARTYAVYSVGPNRRDDSGILRCSGSRKACVSRAMSA